MGQVARRMMEMNQDQLEGRMWAARGVFVKVFLLSAGDMVIGAVLMALVGRVVKTVGLLASGPEKTAIDPLVLALALFGAAVLSGGVGMILCLRGAFGRRFPRGLRLDPDQTADVEGKVDDLLRKTLPGLDERPDRNAPGSRRRSGRLAWPTRLLVLAALLTAGVIYIFVSH
jgi:hypothetical protein